MNYKMLRHLIGVLLLIEAGLLLLPLIVALIYQETPLPFLFTILILCGVGLPLALLPHKDRKIYAKEGFVCVALSWILLSAFGALPFVFDGAIPNYIDAFFETVSGFTTTGATLLAEIESLPRGILFWRSFTHWVGGMGVLVFLLAILPSDNARTIHLMRAEVPGPTKGKLVPKLRQSALILYKIYIVLTFIQIIALLIAGLPLYDSITTSLATAGTGGFAVKNASIAAYANPAAEWIVAIFMLLFGINFNLFYFALIRKFSAIWKSEELRAYLLICVTSCALIVWNTYSMFASIGDSIRAAFFQVTSIMSTSGFFTVNFDLWPAFSKTILVILMIFGACAGSTAGGLKISRLLILKKTAVRELKYLLHPKSVHVIRMDEEVIPEETVHATSGYFVLYAALNLLFFGLVSLDGFDLVTNLTAVFTCINNVGPGLSLVGPVGNFSIFSPLSKILLSIAMLVGRLEILPFAVLLSPSVWKKAR